MLILRVRQAEVAVDAGRLDEAFEIVNRDGRFRSNRRGQEVITRIVTALVLRGRQYLEAGRLPQAGCDCDKAGRLGGGDLPDVAQLVADLRDEQLGRQRGHRKAALAVAAARRCVEDGALSAGRRMLAGVDDSRAKRLMNDIDDHRTRIEAALSAARRAADRADWPAAVEAIARCRSIAPADPRPTDVTATVADALATQARSEMAAGRLDRVAQTAELLRRVDSDSTVACDVERAVRHCTRAWAFVGQGRPHEAEELLRRAAVLFPSTAWMNDALKQLQVAAEAIGQLRAGPLSLIGDATSFQHNATIPVPRPARPAVLAEGGPDTVGQANRGTSAPNERVGAGMLPDRFVLQVDGAGAFLVVRSAVAKVGPISSCDLPDVALIADATSPAVTIERLEDDYFLRSPSPVTVNDRPATNALLGSGDRIGLSPRCRFTFALPHPASTTAVLDLVGARYPRADVRRVILLDRDIVLSAGPASHVRVPGLAEPVVLNFRGGILRTSVEATVDGKPLGREEGLPLDVSVAAGGARFVIGRV